MMQNLPAIGAVSDLSELRTVLYQSGTLVHGPYGMGMQPADDDLTALVAGSIGAAKAFRRGNVRGTVTQSGGVPTGALIEAGNNANGAYARFADGTQICTSILGASATASVEWTFPIAFSSTTNLSVTGAYVAAGDPHTANPIFIQYGTLTASSVLFSARRSDTGAAATVNARHTAIGRWF